MKAAVEEKEETKRKADRKADCCIKGKNAFNQLQHTVEKWRGGIQEPAPSIHYERQTLLLRRVGETRRDGKFTKGMVRSPARAN